MDAETILLIIGTAVPPLLGVIGLIAEKTDNESLSKIVKWARRVWRFVPIGQMDPKKMGKLKG